MPRILVIEDEQDLAALLEYNLKGDGHQVDLAHSGAAGMARLRELKPDLVLLDLMLPDISGSEVARMVRQESPGSSLIMVTAKGEEAVRVKGLELGADDYVVKPFSVKELLLRVRAVLRRGGESSPGSPSRLTFKDLVLDFERHEVTAGGAVVVLTALEF